MSTFSPSEAALEGFRLTRERPGAILAWGGVYSMGIVLMALVMGAGLGPNFIAFLRSDSLQSNDPEAIAKFGEMLAQSWPAFLLALVIAIFVLAIITGGMYRLILRPEERGFAHLRIGPDEVRLAVTHFLLLCIGIGSLILTEIVASLAVGVVGMGLAASLVSIIPIALMAWAGVRLSLATPLAFAEKRISLPAAWRLTRGRFWKLFGMILLSLLFWLMVVILVSIISFVLVTLGGGRQAVMEVTTNPTPLRVIAFVVVIVVQLVMPAIQAVMVYSPFAVAYRQLRNS